VRQSQILIITLLVSTILLSSLVVAQNTEQEEINNLNSILQEHEYNIVLKIVENKQGIPGIPKGTDFYFVYIRDQNEFKRYYNIKGEHYIDNETSQTILDGLPKIDPKYLSISAIDAFTQFVDDLVISNSYFGNSAPIIDATQELISFGNIDSGFKLKPVVLSEGCPDCRNAHNSQVTIVTGGVSDKKAKKIEPRVLVVDDNTAGSEIKEGIIIDDDKAIEALTYKLEGEYKDKDLPMTVTTNLFVFDDGTTIVNGKVKKGKELESSKEVSLKLCPIGDEKNLVDRGRATMEIVLDTSVLKRIIDLTIAVAQKGLTFKIKAELGGVIAKDIARDTLKASDKVKISLKLNKINQFMNPESEFCGFPVIEGEGSITAESGIGLKQLIEVYNKEQQIGTQIVNAEGTPELVIGGTKGEPLRVKNLLDMMLKDLGLSFEQMLPPEPEIGWVKTKDLSINIRISTDVKGPDSGVLNIRLLPVYYKFIGRNWRGAKQYERVIDKSINIPVVVSKKDIENYISKYSINLDKFKSDDEVETSDNTARKGSIGLFGIGVNWEIKPTYIGGETISFSATRIASVKASTDISLEKATAMGECCIGVFPTGTMSSSIYTLRKSHEPKSGIAYQFLPSMTFSKPVDRLFKNKEKDQTIYVYDEDELSLCTITKLDSQSADITQSGGSIDTPDLTFTIPKNALYDTTKIEVNKIQLDCPSCDNSIKDGNEEGIDCGGSCWTDCVNCFNNIQDGYETGVDCGGSECSDCTTPIESDYEILECTTNNDCSDYTCPKFTRPVCTEYNVCSCDESLEEVCGNNFCEFEEFAKDSCSEDCLKPSCNDNIKNQGETKVDGGLVCQKDVQSSRFEVIVPSDEYENSVAAVIIPTGNVENLELTLNSNQATTLQATQRCENIKRGEECNLLWKLESTENIFSVTITANADNIPLGQKTVIIERKQKLNINVQTCTTLDCKQTTTTFKPGKVYIKSLNPNQAQLSGTLNNQPLEFIADAAIVTLNKPGRYTAKIIATKENYKDYNTEINFEIVEKNLNPLLIIILGAIVLIIIILVIWKYTIRK
jgi:hypothetical protein